MYYNDGFVGVGRRTVVSPSEVFGLYRNTADYAGMYVRTSADAGKPYYGYKAGNSASMWTYADGTKWKVYNAGDQLTIDRGQTGLGTVDPLAKLHVRAGDLSLPSAGLDSDDLVIESNDAILGIYSSDGGSVGSGIRMGEVIGGTMDNYWGMYRRTTASNARFELRYADSADTRYPFRMWFDSTALYGESPNVLFGHDENAIATGVIGAVIGGGGNAQAGQQSEGPNTINDHFCTIGGGMLNVAGVTPNNNSSFATIGGGRRNQATDLYATVGGGQLNVASGGNATIGGGGTNTASGAQATVAGGWNNTATNIYATVVGGESNDATGQHATALGGYGCEANGHWSVAFGRQAEANHSGAWVWSDSDNTTFASTGADQFLIDADGGVGIGSNSPDATLLVRQEASQALADFAILRARDVDGGTKFKVEESGNVTVGSNATESTQLLVEGDSGENALRVRVDGNTELLVHSNHGVYINGNSTPQFDLHVNGSAGKPGGGLWGTASDRRLKKNIRDLDQGLETLLALRGVTFEYKDPDAIGELAGTRLGLVAQEVERVIPDWVSVAEDGYKRVNVRGLTPLVIEALRDLRDEKDAEIADLHDRVASLQHRNDELNDRLAQLESIVRRLAASKE